MQAQPYDFTLTAGGSQKLDVAGTSFKLLSSTGPVQVLANTGARILVNPGQGIRRFEFDSLILLDKSGAANVGQILITGSEDGAEMIDDRITGEVSVIDGAMARTLAGTAFWGSVYVPSVAGSIGVCELYNGASSAKNMIVERIGIAPVGAGGTFHIGFISGSVPGNSGNVPMRSKLSGAGASSSGLLYYGSNPGSVFSWIVDLYLDVPGRTEFIQLPEPMVIRPGLGLCVDCGSANQAFSVNFEFFEVPV